MEPSDIKGLRENFIIRALEIEHEGKVYRLEGVGLDRMTSWESPFTGGGFKYKGVGALSADMPWVKNQFAEPVEVGQTWCVCGHLERDHLPECIYKLEGCECEGYVGVPES